MRKGTLKTRAKQHDDEVSSSANATPQPPQRQLTLPQVEVPWPPPRPPQAKPMVPRRMLPNPDTSHPLVSPVAHPLAGHVRNASNTLLEPRVPTVPTVPVVSTPVLPHEIPRSLLTDPHPHPPVFSPGSRACSLSCLAGYQPKSSRESSSRRSTRDSTRSSLLYPRTMTRHPHCMISVHFLKTLNLVPFTLSATCKR